MREKYIEERFNLYFMHGGLSDSDGTLDTEKIIKDREEVVEMLTKLAIKLNDVDRVAFNKIWYKE